MDKVKWLKLAELEPEPSYGMWPEDYIELRREYDAGVNPTDYVSSPQNPYHKG